MKTFLIGWPIAHSVSPAMHNAAFQALGIAGEYSLLPVERMEDLARTLAGLQAFPDWAGANVTVPWKEKVIPHLASLSGAATTLRAVNTIVREAGRLIGHNTDLPGFLADLKRNGMEFENKPALVIGSGGAARAVVLGLVENGCNVTIIAVLRDQAELLARELGQGQVEISAWDDPKLPSRIRSAGLIVNASPVGMWPETGASPWPREIPLPAQACVYDLVYNPFETGFLKEARTQGLRAASGLGMLVEQGALAFEMWTGHTAPREVMRSAALAVLEGSRGS
jgi:shikimate dehydrogenase